jgi:hypothetical protein
MGERHALSVAPPGLWWWVGPGVAWWGSESHGSRRGLIADALTGTREQQHRSVVLNGEASELEH